MFKGLNLKLSWMIASLILFLSPASSIASVANQQNNASDFVIFSLNPTFSALSKSKARMLYKGRVKKIDNKKISLIDWTNDSDYKSRFYQLLLGKNISQISGYRAGLAFSGRGNLPITVEHDDLALIVKWLTENPNGIAYAPADLLPENVNVLITISEGQ